MYKQTILTWNKYPEVIPPNGEPVLVTYNWKGLLQNKFDDYEVGIGEYFNPKTVNRDTVSEKELGFGYKDTYITAWAPLPEPYTGGEEKEEDRKFDIWNHKPRYIKCISNHMDEVLEVGKIYKLTGVEVHSWHTEVFLEEFENVVFGFNSVQFVEVNKDE